ncbi:unnamed protein product [Trichobilharzia regenti]|nr:unnamed protein product [Trichobilharzia regenti]
MTDHSSHDFLMETVQQHNSNHFTTPSILHGTTTNLRAVNLLYNNNEKIPEDIVETMNPSKVYIFNQNKNTPYEVHSAAMHIPSSNIWESYHSDYNATDPLKKFIHEKMFAYPNQTIQPKGSVYYTQLNKFSPVINSVEMGSLSGQSCSNASSDPVNNGDQTHNNTLMRTTAIVDDSNDNSNNNNNNKLLLTNIPDHETTANQTTDSKSNHPARNYAVCANGIISVSDYMTLSLHDTHNHQCTTKNMTPTNCHFLMNAINFDQLNNNNGNNNQLTRNSSPYIDHKHQHSHVPLINTVCQQNHQHHYPHSCTPPGQRCQTMSTMSRKSPNLLKHCTLHTPVVDYTTNSKTEIISSIKGRTQIKTSMNEPNNNDNNNKEGEENENDGGCIPHAEEEEEHNEECFKTSALKSGSFV